MSDENTPGERLKPWQFQPGNPGRPKGSRNKLGEDFIAALAEHFAANREKALDGCLEESPSAYCRVIAAIVPRELLIKNDAFEGASDEEVAALIAIARTALAAHNGGREETRATAH